HGKISLRRGKQKHWDTKYEKSIGQEPRRKDMGQVLLVDIDIRLRKELDVTIDRFLIPRVSIPSIDTSSLMQRKPSKIWLIILKNGTMEHLLGVEDCPLLRRRIKKHFEKDIHLVISEFSITTRRIIRAAVLGILTIINGNPSNQRASIKALEIQIGKMSKVLQERGSKNLPSSNETNLRDHVKSILTIVDVDTTSIRCIGPGRYAVRAHRTFYMLIDNEGQDFIVMENMDSYRDEGMGDVIVGRPFCKEACVKARRFDEMITIYKRDDSVTYQIARSHPRFKHLTNAQRNKVRPLLKVSTLDEWKDISHPYQKLKGFYESVNLGPEYIKNEKVEEWLTRGQVSVHEME
ncbi:hypothetical protein Tco_0065474, partial [Tanacetum coccineum]